MSALDAKGAPVTSLTAADFRVREDGVAREVLKAGPATEPLTIALLVDDSQAAGRSIQMIREGVQKFVTALAGKAEIAIITYGDRPTIAVDYTTDQKKLLDGAGRLFPASGSGAYLLDAIVDASKGLQKRSPARRTGILSRRVGGSICGSSRRVQTGSMRWRRMRCSFSCTATPWAWRSSRILLG